MKLNIRQQILLLIGINSVLIILVLYISYSGIVNINSARDNFVHKARQLNYLLVAQNMRDNVRGIIYRGFAVDRSNEKEITEIKDEFQTQLNAFISNTERLVEMDDTDSLLSQINAKAKEFAVFSTTLFSKEMDGDAESFLIINDFPALYNSLVVPMNVLNANIQRNYAILEEESNSTAKASLSGIFSISIFSILGSIVISILISNRISRRINRASNIISEVSIGKLPERNDATGSDEVGVMLKSLNNYLDSVTETVKFAVQVGKGNLNAEYKALSEYDQLGHSLLEMRNNLKKVSQEDEKRNWTLNGMAKYVEISRRESHDIESFAEHVLSYLVKYLKVNQAFFYTVEEKEDQEVLMLKAAYAWDKKKQRQHEIEKGNGLTGQVWQEGSMMYLRDIPGDYIRITSGLGTAAPRNLVILPLKINEVVYGMIEIASFQDIESHELNFLEKIAENIASTLANVQTAEKTKELLYQSQEQTVRLHAQEEEMRQSMEEMQATQEELARKEKEYMQQIFKLKEELKAYGKVLEQNESRLEEEDMKDQLEEALRKQGEMAGGILINRSLL
ncbi:GAF domain-containing protein [Ohtaekwangia koreensis]|uniref:HAMP domain-containing protein n=1 Tax=Ohtaekwangia koreensis TaxID=688867 RepID=A0A1T5MCF4_9BACT|nr:GAF domain-containing protein [Ohtaekwangia koreensis]SKC85753.1 HAMP domain-containing protein [Ohtaekwangia koreensis]